MELHFLKAPNGNGIEDLEYLEKSNCKSIITVAFLVTTRMLKFQYLELA
jgi:hypothetical protein